jgi:hypothetical protein
MSSSQLVFDVGTSTPPLRVAHITSVTKTQIRAIDPFTDTDYACELLGRSEDEPLLLRPGDEVLISELRSPETRYIVLGRLGLPRRPDEAQPETTSANGIPVPDTLLIEARESLTLRVGDGSITIRADGKILIKGKDLVSHATNLNRVKGGAVAIN